MFDELIELGPEDNLTIDNDESRQLTGQEDFKVTASEFYETDGGEICIVNLGDYFLVSHAFSGSPRYFVYELYDDGEGLYCKNDNFVKKIIIESGDRGKAIYRRNDVYTAEDSEISFADFRSDNYFEYILLKRNIDDVEVMRGFEINESDIVI